MYSKMLKSIRMNNNLKQKDIAIILNISEVSYTNYENEYYIIPIEYLIMISVFFRVSIDYILDLNNDTYNIIDTDKIKAGTRLKEFRKENKLTQEKLAKILNTNRSVIANYERGRNYIATPFLYTICKKYNISADYLLGRIDSPKYLN